MVLGCQQCDQARLRGAVGLADDGPEPLQSLLHPLAVAGRCPVGDGAKGGEVRVGAARRVEQLGHLWRGEHHMGDGFGRHQAQRGGGVEALVQYECAAARQRGQADVPAEVGHVAEDQGPPGLLFRSGVLARGGQGVDEGVGVHDALGNSRRSARAQQEAHGGGRRLGHGRTAIISKPEGVRGGVVHGLGLDTGDAGGKRFGRGSFPHVEEEPRRPGLAQEALLTGPASVPRDVGDRPARHVAREVGDECLRLVAREHRDRALLRAQLRGEVGGPSGQRPERDPLPVVDDRLTIRPVSGGCLQRLHGIVHRGPLPAHVLPSV